MPVYQKNAHRIAVLLGNADDRCFLRAGVLTLACDTVADLGHYAENHIEEALDYDGQEGSHNASQTIRRHADVVVERSDRFSGGVYAVLQSVSHSRAVDARTRMFLQFWLHSLLARFLMVIFSVFTGIGFFSILQMFLSSFALEVVAVFFFAELPFSQQTLRHPRMIDKTFLEQTLFAKEKLLPTVISVAITALVAIILTLADVLTKSVAATYLFFSLFLLQICIMCRICFTEKAKPQSKRTLLLGGILIGVLALLTLLSTLIVPIGAVTGMGAWTMLTAILLPLTPALYLISTLLLPFCVGQPNNLSHLHTMQ